MAFLPLLGLALLALPAQQEAPRLRTLLANGATLHVERFAGAQVLSVQLFVSSRSAGENAETHGHRHLLEHLILKGQRGDLDRRMESQGVFFTGRTHRDSIQFEFTGKPDQLEALLSGAQELIVEPKFTQAVIDHERSIMVEEFALVPDHQRLSRTAWDAGFGIAGLDPFGTEAAIATATPSSLVKLHQALFKPSQMVVLVAGDVDLKETTAKIRSMVEDLPIDDEPASPPKRAGNAARGVAEDAFGEVRAAVASGIDKDTAATLCAAYGLAAWIEGAHVTYTPSATGGLVLVGRTDANNALGSVIDELGEREEAFLYSIGKELARGWIRGQLAAPTSAASLRGLLLSQAPHLRPETLLDAIDQVGWSDFRRGVLRFKRDHAVIAVGSRR